MNYKVETNKFVITVKINVERVFVMDKKEELSGGRIGKIYKSDEFVIRPLNPWTKNVHDFLNFIIAKGADFVPHPQDITNDEEILSFLHGDVYNYPLPENLRSDSVLKCSAELLYRYHEYSKEYIVKLTGNEQWMLTAVYPIEVMCHGDFAPYNVTIIENCPTGIIDFDTLHPGSILWDISYAIYRWVPFTSPKNPDHYDDLDEQIRKAKLFLDSYGVEINKRAELPQILINRLQSLVNFMRAEAKKGNEDFILNINEGHLKLYLDDIQYINDNLGRIKDGIQF